jgi:SNW domain-containing protein 1
MDSEQAGDHRLSTTMRMVVLIQNAMSSSTHSTWARRRSISYSGGATCADQYCKASSGNTLTLQVDGEGNVRYDAIALQGHREGRNVQSQFKDLVPLAHRKDLDESEKTMDRPSEEDVANTTEKTRLALEKLVSGKIKASQPKHVPDAMGKTSFIRYTPSQQGGEGGIKQRIIKMAEVVEDPLEPPRFKHKKIPRGPPSPPPPVLRSPPRKATAQEQKEWMIPPCISNWKNNKGFTIPLDKRLAADGRGLQDVS